MNVRQAREAAREWIELNREQYPGLRAAHLVGSITGMPFDAPFPTYKDLDFHLICSNDSPSLIRQGPFAPIVETSHRGVVLEGGLKPISDYRSAEAVVANPEIAHHLTLDSILYDPHQLLAGLQPEVRREYPRRSWVLERIAYEQRGLNGILDLLPVARQMGLSAEVNILGYSFNFITAVLCVATLRAPTTGSRMFLHLHDILSEYGQADLHDEALSILGLQNIQPVRIEQLLQEGTQAFDLAVQVKLSPHPFQHKINAHQRDYFIQSVRALINEGLYMYASAWLAPFYLSTHDILLIDGPESQKAKYNAQLRQFLGYLELDTPKKCVTANARARRVYNQCFTLARQIANSLPE